MIQSSLKKTSSYSIFPLFFGLLIFALDFVSKWLVNTYIPLMTREYPYGGIGVFRDFFGIEFSITHMTNSGAAWGMFHEYGALLLFIRIALIVALAIYTMFFNPITIYRIPFTMIIAGAISNVLDHFVYGHVVDMFHFVLWGYDYPVFNIADSAIFLGVVSLFFLSYKLPKERP